MLPCLDMDRVDFLPVAISQVLPSCVARVPWGFLGGTSQLPPAHSTVMACLP